MDVGRPITSVIPTLDGPVLEVLARTTHPLTGRDVHRLARAGSESGVRLVLNRLSGQGLVTATPAGKATLYVANRNHLAWPSVEGLTQLRQQLLEHLRDLAASWAAKPLTVAVFGSAARGDGDAASDIDILTIHPDSVDEIWERQIDDLRDRVAEWTGNVCQVYDLTEPEYHQHLKTDEPIVQEWRNDSVVVFGNSLANLNSARLA